MTDENDVEARLQVIEWAVRDLLFKACVSGPKPGDAFEKTFADLSIMEDEWAEIATTRAKDDRTMMLALDVSGGFGRLKAELLADLKMHTDGLGNG